MSGPAVPSSDASRDEGGATESLSSLLALLDLETLDTNVFRGVSPRDRWQRVFGGQVLGQALMAAYRTVEVRECHSLHAYFLRAGAPKIRILYEVDRSRDGLSFSARRVVAVQHNEPIFTMSASFEVPEAGLEHQIGMPSVREPESLKSEREWRMEILADLPEHARGGVFRERPIGIRPVEPPNRFATGKHPPRQIVWFRAAGPLPTTAALHQCVLAYASDMTLLDTSLLPHGYNLFSSALQLASLDHAMC